MRHWDPIKYLCTCIYEKVDEGFSKKKHTPWSRKWDERHAFIDFCYRLTGYPSYATNPPHFLFLNLSISLRYKNIQQRLIAENGSKWSDQYPHKEWSQNIVNNVQVCKECFQYSSACMLHSFFLMWHSDCAVGFVYIIHEFRNCFFSWLLLFRELFRSLQEPVQVTRYSELPTKFTTVNLGLDYQRNKEIFPFFKTSRPVLVLVLVQGSLSSG